MLSSEKIISRQKMREEISALRKENRKIVFTNGCFDILHVGHIALLEKAKSFGDYLIVGLNTDASVKRLKGPFRPILLENERARLIAALGVVDYVVFFDEDTPFEILHELQPDVLVKGGDYDIKDIVGHDFIPKVEVITLVKDKSTTNIIDKIKALPE